MLIVLIVLDMLVVLIMLIMLVVANVLNPFYIVTPCGDHSPCVGIVSGPTVGTNVLAYFLRFLMLSFASPTLSPAPLVGDLQGTPILKSKLLSTQV